MDTPYEEALQTMWDAANKEGDFYADEYATIEMIRAAAEAIGLREMMEALEFYGDSGNWHIPVVSGSHVVVDGGFKAREAMRKG